MEYVLALAILLEPFWIPVIIENLKVLTNLIGGNCQSCTTGCYVCSGVGANSCTACNGTLFLYLGQCLSTCPQGFFANSSN